MPEAPSISVLLPVYNGQKYVADSIKSILSQSETDFELIVIDDGSTDDSYSVVQQFADPRIRTVRHENRGLAATLNVGLAEARGKYIARQDQDDISLAERFARQVAFLEANPLCGLLGTWAAILENDKPSGRVHRHPIDSPRLKFELLFNNPFVHSSVVARREALISVGGYSTDTARQPPEDYELWSRVAQRWEINNLPMILVHYRETPGSMTRNPGHEYRERLTLISSENLARLSGRSATCGVVQSVANLVHRCPTSSMSHLRAREVYDVLRDAVSSISPLGDRTDLLKSAKWRTFLVMCAYWSLRMPCFGRVYRSNALRMLAKSFRNRLAAVR